MNLASSRVIAHLRSQVLYHITVKQTVIKRMLFYVHVTVVGSGTIWWASLLYCVI